MGAAAGCGLVACSTSSGTDVGGTDSGSKPAADGSTADGAIVESMDGGVVTDSGVVPKDAGGDAASASDAARACADFVGSCTIAMGQCREIGAQPGSGAFPEQQCKAVDPNGWSVAPCPTAARVGGCKYTGAAADSNYTKTDCYVNWYYDPPNKAPLPGFLCNGGTQLPP